MLRTRVVSFRDASDPRRVASRCSGLASCHFTMLRTRLVSLRVTLDSHRITLELRRVTLEPHRATSDPRRVTSDPHCVALGPRRVTSDPRRVASCRFVLPACYFRPVAQSKVHHPAESACGVLAVQCLYSCTSVGMLDGAPQIVFGPGEVCAEAKVLNHLFTLAQRFSATAVLPSPCMVRRPPAEAVLQLPKLCMLVVAVALAPRKFLLPARER